MRIIDVISEASIFTRKDKYTYGHKVRVGVNSAKGNALFQAISAQIPAFDPTEDLEWIKPESNANGVIPPKGTPVVQFGTGTTQRHFKRPNNTYLTIAGTDNSIQSGLVHAPGQKGSTEKNVGDLSEPVLSAAVVAKLIKRGHDNVEDITNEDVIHCLNSAIANGENTFTVSDKNSTIADEIKFTISVREPTKLFMQSPEFWETYGPLLPSAVHYANSGQIDRYANYFYKNGKVDTIWIKSDGMSAQKEKKTDIEAFVKKVDGTVEPLKHLKLSLKAGSSQFGQQGAGSLTSDVTSTKGVWQSTVNFFGPFGVPIDQPKRAPKSKVEFWVKAYKQAAAHLKSELKGTSARAAAGVISRITNVILHHATKGEPDVRLVQLGRKGVSTVHSFRNLEQKLIAQNIDLTASYREGTSNNWEPRPEINIFDKNSGKSLIKLGYHATGDNKKIWNAITMEPLLAELTTMSVKQKPTVQATPAPQPQQQTQEPEAPVVPSILKGPKVNKLQGTTMAPVDQQEEPVEPSSVTTSRV